MRNLFSRLFNPQATAADGLTQSQREALIDLLNFCSYADDRLELAEDRVVDKELAQCQWDPAVPLELFVSRSITRVRDALESPERRANFIAGVTAQLGAQNARARALDLSRNLFRADGTYAPDEETLFGELERAFR